MKKGQWTIIRLRFRVLRSALMLLFFFIVNCQLSIVNSAFAQPGWIPTSQNPVPAKPKQLVNDWGDMLSPGEEESLERKLVAESDSTSTQIAVLTITDLNGYD